MSKESSATIKLTKSEIKSTILALAHMEYSANMLNEMEGAKFYKKIKEDFTLIKNQIENIEDESRKQLDNNNY